jgi:RHS repeat-associated protein
VDIQYDAANRRTLLTLPNGVSTEYQYDVASRLTALIYRNAIGILGDLAYSYDGAGNRMAVGGSFARTLFPEAVASVTYDQGNRQLAFGTKMMTFDDTGNLLTKTGPSGTITYTWDARNRLSGLSGPITSASFSYDAFSRRVARLINGQLASYQYDGPDIIQERLNGTLMMYLRSFTTDEAFARGQTEFYLADPLRSTLALADLAGGVATTYTYEPFGLSRADGLLSGNPFQFTGREVDGTGLTYYRARYYDPSTKRFLAEDPVGPIGGINRYAYAANNPIRYLDPTGLIPGVPEIPDGLDNVPAELIAVVYAEATRESYEAKLAVANVVKNRLQDATHEFRSLYTYEQVIYQKYAFEAVSNERFSLALQVLSGRKPKRLLPQESKRLAEAFRAAQAAQPYNNRAPDPTGGALFFYSPNISQPTYIKRGVESGTLEQASPPGVSPNDFLFYRYAR